MKQKRIGGSLANFIGNNLLIIRQKNNTNQTQVAKQVGIHTATYSKYERGKQIPDAGFVVKFCDVFSVNPTWLLTGQGPMQMPKNPSGIETDLLRKIIEKIEETLTEKKLILSPAKKAEVISILYDEAIEQADWREQLGLDKKTKRFLNLLAEEDGSDGRG